MARHDTIMKCEHGFERSTLSRCFSDQSAFFFGPFLLSKKRNLGNWGQWWKSITAELERNEMLDNEKWHDYTKRANRTMKFNYIISKKD